MDLYNCTNEQSTACDVKIDYFLTPLTFNNTYEYILFICQNEILLQNIIIPIKELNNICHNHFGNITKNPNKTIHAYKVGDIC